MKKKQIIKEAKALFSAQRTCLAPTVKMLHQFSKQPYSDHSLEFIQLKRCFCHFDGWSEEDLLEYGFELLYAELPQRQVTIKYHAQHFCSVHPGARVKISEKYTLPDIAHDKTTTKCTLKKLYFGIREDENFRGLFHPQPTRGKEGKLEWKPATSFNSPIIIRKMIMIKRYGRTDYDVYHWFKTAAMTSDSGNSKEVKTLLTHVNGISVFSIFNLEANKALRDRVLESVKDISTEKPCTVKGKEVIHETQVSCTM